MASPRPLSPGRSSLPPALQSPPLYRRVAFLTAFAVALAVAVTGLAAFLTTRLALYDQLDKDLLDVGRVVAERLPPGGSLDDFESPDLWAGNLVIVQVDVDRQTVTPSTETITVEPTTADIEVAKIQQGTAQGRTQRASNGRLYRVVTVPLAPNKALLVARAMDPTNDILGNLSLVLLIFGASGVFWAAMAGAAVARSSLAPVRRLSTAVDRVAQTGNLRPVAVSGDDELSRLAVGFNRMLASLSTSQERQRRLIADAGHELRTPLTSMRTNIELLASDQHSNSLPPAARAEIFDDVTAQLAEFSALIGDLVQLARDDRVEAAPEPVDVRTVAQAAVERARRRGHGLTFDVELNPLYVFGEPDSLERAFTNLLDNAVKFSPPGGTVRVHLEGDRLRIADQGPGIAEEDLPFVFDRFFRSELARNTPGTGLGLSIVAQTVARHGGWVRAARSAQGGAEFTVFLPGSTTLAGLDTNRSLPEDAVPAATRPPNGRD